MTPETLKLKVAAKRNLFGKSSGQYVATIAGVEQTAPTKEQAVQQLSDMVDNVFRHAYCRRYLVCSDGTVFSLYHVPGGWAYDIIPTGTPGAQCPGSCMMGESYVNAYDAMKRHWQSMEDDILARKAAIAA